MKHYARISLAIFLILSPCAACAGSAQIVLFPTRIVLEKNERTAALGLKNTGDAAGNYRIELVDLKMTADGDIKPLPESENDPYSLKKMMRVSPRSVTLEGGQEQSIRLMIQKPRDLADGEYRSHLKVTMVDSNAGSNAAKAAPDKGLGVSIKARVSMSIPIIIRYGKTDYAMKLSAPRYYSHRDDEGKTTPYVDVTLHRTGNRSSMGDLTVIYTDKNGKSRMVKQLAGVPVYRGADQRKVSLPLDISGGAIGKGTLTIRYKTQEKEGTILLAETTINL
jgi:hypothetical protein